MFERKMTMRQFLDNQLDVAETFYRERETQTRDNPDVSVVLISAGHVKDIKKAYPNYFLDTNEFVRNLQAVAG